MNWMPELEKALQENRLAFKCTNWGGYPCNGGKQDHQLALGPDNEPGEWLPTQRREMCCSGYHVTVKPYQWQGSQVWLVETKEPINLANDKSCVSSLRAVALVNPAECINPGVWVVASKANLSEANLSGANLSNADLSRADLSGANLCSTDLLNTNLSRADLSRANLTKANLSNANLFGADLTGADLTRANFQGADLTGANLLRAHLAGADLSEANLTRANLRKANLLGANLSSANLRMANFCEANLSEVILFEVRNAHSAFNFPEEIEGAIQR